MDSSEVERRLNLALQILDKNDSYLLEIQANERAITHKLAQYVETVFPKYDVDCEYNRNGTEQKVIQELKQQANDGQPIPPDDTKAITVFPDIIIHRRGKPPQGNNFVVIEAKKLGRNDDWDHRKLLAYKRQLGYEYAFMVTLGKGDKAHPSVCEQIQSE